MMPRVLAGLAIPLFLLLITGEKLYAGYAGHPSLIPRMLTVPLYLVFGLLLEFIWRNTRTQPEQRRWARDLSFSFFNAYVTTGLVFVVAIPMLNRGMSSATGHPNLAAAGIDLGPLWLQSLVVLVGVDFMRYWLHRAQHTSRFLWRFHGVHHSPSGLYTGNALFSHPLDFAIRILVPFFIPIVVGFHPAAVACGAGFLAIVGVISHCNAKVPYGWLNKLFSTNEVHRWHHVKRLPLGFADGLNFGVSLIVWDRIFGTYYFPGSQEQPEALGHPERVDEPTGLVRLIWPRA